MDSETQALEVLDARLRTLLPEAYQETYEAMQPRPMGSAGLKYGDDGLVAWDQIWGSFCDLAMAGGPPHKGTLLEPGGDAEIDAHFGRYDEVVDEIVRGIRLVTGLRAYPSPTLGWVCISCLSDGMAAWLVRAIAMENVAVRRRGSILELPAAPHFRLEKEIKNVITVVAKTCHYWLGHMPPEQQRAVAELFAALGTASPLVEPDPSGGDADAEAACAERIGGLVCAQTALVRAPPRYAGWIGFECGSLRVAVWMMRALVAENVLSRREESVLFVPVNPTSDSDGTRTAAAVARVHRLARHRGVLDH